jgi:hypothetical protein
LPAGSVAVAVNVCGPSGSTGVSTDHLPSSPTFTVAIGLSGVGEFLS